jgi:hypothetical protein
MCPFGRLRSSRENAILWASDPVMFGVDQAQAGTRSLFVTGLIGGYC